MQIAKGKFSVQHQLDSISDSSLSYSAKQKQYKINNYVKAGNKKVFRFWQAGGGFDRNLWNAKAIHSSIKYNPVRAGLVQAPEEWHWSSAHARYALVK